MEDDRGGFHIGVGCAELQGRTETPRVSPEGCPLLSVPHPLNFTCSATFLFLAGGGSSGSSNDTKEHMVNMAPTTKSLIEYLNYSVLGSQESQANVL